MVTIKNAPAIRFKGFDEEWGEKALVNLTTLITKGTTPLNKSGNGVINYIKIENISPSSGLIESTSKITEEEHIGYLKRSQLKKNDILFSIAGTLGRVTIVKEDILPANTNQALAIIRLKDVSIDFVSIFLKGRAISSYIKKNPTVGAQPNLSLLQIANFSIPIPLPTEQTQIGNYLKELDNLILLQENKLEKIANLKKAMLEKMFPKEGADVPEIRFKRFTEKWEKKKLGELAVNLQYGLNAAATKYDGIHKYLRITDIDESSHQFNIDALTSPDIDLINADNYKLKKGDILFARTGASVGKTYHYNENDGLVYFAGFLIRARIKSDTDSEFVFQNTLRSEYMKFIRITSQRSGQPGVNAQEYSDYLINTPSLQEQKKIGSYFKTLDQVISQSQQITEQLKRLKQALLQKMFI